LLGRLLEQGFGKAELSKRFSRRRPGEHSTADAKQEHDSLGHVRVLQAATNSDVPEMVRMVRGKVE
jgi:hypothetical protein